VKVPKFLKNKFTITTSIFLIYVLFLDDNDIFTVYSNINKRNSLSAQNKEVKLKLEQNRTALQHLNQTYYLEHYARSKKFFKASDEDIFVIIPKDSIKE